MTTTSKLFDSIRISSNKKKQGQSQIQKCQWEGCEKTGSHKAPAGRNHEGQYLYFCIEHIRAYNKNFNYFSGLSDKDIAKFHKDALTGHRPTWSARLNNSTAKKTASDYAKIRSGTAAYQNRMRDPFKLFTQRNSNNTNKRKLKPLEAKAFDTLGLQENASAEDIKTKYKELVKKHHPDANGGNRSSEERFRDVLHAYNLLKKSGRC
ncbi:DnaJ-related protein [Bartonella clarridgeiae 73]|uniref:DnaJ-related protein n=1 Tax=Bartonella clarridgeiae (strain CCUG 45776 / CIP 104772 / 73) TaxID=696125 RepID=E6YJE2_BARC7|nr:J domain-containing protein [Bartonella clarridgeiae]WCR55786.1 MAG: putative with DnaJ-like domain [Bartonella clarridgeiae]CBI76980.1 DnaJ-related protein [Bartonella clarridgeiae 73]